MGLLGIFGQARKFTPYSQKTLIQLASLRAELERCLAMIFYHEKELERAGAIADHQVKSAVGGSGLGDYRLPQVLTQLEGFKLQLAAYKKHADGLREKINALENPTPAEKSKRAETQALLAKLAVQRVGKDASIQQVVEQLQNLLFERAKLTTAMVEAATEIGFTRRDDGFDEARFNNLGAALPPDLVKASERWAEEFLGAV